MIMNNINNKKVPIVFVTGIGQTWTTVRGSKGERWNLFPTSKETLFGDFGAVDYLPLVRLGRGLVFKLLFGSKINKDNAIKAFSSVFKLCIPLPEGPMPEKADVRIYGPRSFDRLAKIDFLTGTEHDSPVKDSLLDRLYRDIPCRELANQCGEENLYCFNYSSFSDLYYDADCLYKMICDVVEDQKEKTGADRVVLVPMSMGATVVTAFLDKYYTESGAVERDIVSGVVSIVGAWNGSMAFADLLSFNKSAEIDNKISKLLGSKYEKLINMFGRDKLYAAVEEVFDCFVEALMLNSTSFMALIPCERFPACSERLFTSERMKRKPVLKKVKENALRFQSSRLTLKDKMLSLTEKGIMEFSFIAGYGLHFGDGSRDFDFLSFFGDANAYNTDGVIQISSTAPGSSEAPIGKKVCGTSCEMLSPDGDVDASTCWFPKRSWFFKGQKHELGMNNTALKLAGELALGVTVDIYGKFPQFNEARDVSGAVELVERAERAAESGKLPENKCCSLKIAAEQVRLMLESVSNNPQYDNAVMEALRNELSVVIGF